MALPGRTPRKKNGYLFARCVFAHAAARSPPPNSLGVIIEITIVNITTSSLPTAQNAAEREFIALLAQVPPDQRADVLSDVLAVALAHLPA